MKKVLITAVIFISALLVGLFVINIYEADTEVTKETTKVGVILNGSKDDRSWTQSHCEAMEDTAQELNLDAIFRENINVETFPQTADELIAKGCEIIIANSLEFSDAIVAAAEKYPDVYFFHAAGVVQGRNLATYFGRIYQIRYLCGIVAGLQTETDKIGYVAAIPCSEVNRGINAFALGVRTVNPQAEVYVKWTNSWVDDTAAAEAASELIQSRDIDVLTLHTDSNAPLDVAEEHGVMSIGYNTDNSEYYPDTYLTAAVWDWKNFYTPYILKCLQGKFEGEQYWLGIDTGVVSMAELTDNVKAETAQVVSTYSRKLHSGTFDVFYGPITDSDGNLRIAEGENMTDYIKLNSFDWYVQGVVIEDEAD